MEEQFLCLLPCAMFDIIRICHSISLIYVPHVAVIIGHNMWLYGHPIIITEITLYWCIVDVCQNTYVAFVPPQYCCQVTASPYLKVAPLECHSLGAQVLWHALPLGSDSATTVNLFCGQVIKKVWGEEVIVHIHFVATSSYFLYQF